ncbi:unnamed protein product [Rotaria sordida]|uniref:Coilin tudor domain-containing protein n=1 Tax=Rotaria sordida TaxID=392033 RepID=A0A819UFR1_9BILA|nr:unnamed protein product [Rotaria sordida]
MNAIRVQIHLKYIFDDNSSKKFHNFWYAFEPSKLLTINDIIEDIRLNYLKNHISLSIEEKDEQTFIFNLNDYQLLPFTSSQILRDNDQLTLMSLKTNSLHKKSLQDSINFNLSSSIPIEPPQILSENNNKRQRIESVEQIIPSESTITITKSIENIDEQSCKKKIKTKSTENQVIVPSIIQSTPEPPVVQPTPTPLKEPIFVKELTSEPPLSLPSTNVRIRELRSKTPTWKSQTLPVKDNAQDKMHIRFDSDSDEELLSQTQTTNEENKQTEKLSVVNDINSSIRIDTIPTTISTDITQTKPTKKTVDLLFEMKQHKTLHERQAKQIQQQFGRKRAQHKKRALDYFSMANFVDQAFGLDKSELIKQISPNGYHSSSSTPQTLPTSFNKLARLPLVAEAIENYDKIYDLYPPITQCPSIQTRIAFKLLELGEDFCPKMSTFKEGLVVDVNQTTGELTIQLDNPFQTVFDQPSKFYAPTEEQSEESLTTVVLPFSDLNSVRLLSTSNKDITI